MPLLPPYAVTRIQARDAAAAIVCSLNPEDLEGSSVRALSMANYGFTRNEILYGLLLPLAPDRSNDHRPQMGHSYCPIGRKLSDLKAQHAMLASCCPRTPGFGVRCIHVGPIPELGSEVGCSRLPIQTVGYSLRAAAQQPTRVLLKHEQLDCERICIVQANKK